MLGKDSATGPCPLPLLCLFLIGWLFFFFINDLKTVLFLKRRSKVTQGSHSTHLRTHSQVLSLNRILCILKYMCVGT